MIFVAVAPMPEKCFGWVRFNDDVVVGVFDEFTAFIEFIDTIFDCDCFDCCVNVIIFGKHTIVVGGNRCGVFCVIC